MSIPLRRFVVVYLLFLSTAVYMTWHKERPQPLAQPLAQFPLQIGDWRAMRNDTFGQPLLAVLRPNDYLSRRYVRPGNEAVELYIGYHDRAQGSGPIHSPKNCLPGSGWLEVAAAPLEVEVGPARVRLMQAVYSHGEQCELFLYWFMVRDKIVSSEYGLKLAEISNAIQNGQGGASFIRISLPVSGDMALASTTAVSFFKQIYPEILVFLSFR